MLKITIPENEIYDEKNNLFITIKSQDLQLEHSLVSLSKWESKWMVPFLDNKQKTKEEIIDYIRCMTITQNVNPNIYNFLPADIINQINEYINSPQTASTIYNYRKNNKSIHKETVTSELIYYWMVALQIPFECQKWHLNRLLMLIQICNIKNDPKANKMSKREILNHNRELNAQRLKSLHTNG